MNYSFQGWSTSMISIFHSRWFRYISLILIMMFSAYMLMLIFPSSASAYVHWIVPDSANTISRESMIYRFLVVTFAELGIFFWVGAQLWHSFVFQHASTDDIEVRVAEKKAEQRFVRIFALPSLLIIFLANFGIVVGQGLLLTDGTLQRVFTSDVLPDYILGSYFGRYWLVAQGLVLLALVAASYMAVVSRRAAWIDTALSWLNLVLALGLLTAIVLSGQDVLDGQWQLTTILSNWLHWLAAVLWLGGLLYVVVVLFPALRAGGLRERPATVALLLKRATFFLLSGVILSIGTGILNASTQFSTGLDLQSPYALATLAKVILVVTLAGLTVWQLGILQPRLARTSERRQSLQAIFQVRRIVRVEAILCVAIVICLGLINIFANTRLSNAATSQLPQSAYAKPFNATLETTDQAYTITAKISPNSLGINEFLVEVRDARGQMAKNIDVVVYTTMPEMAMSTVPFRLEAVGNGRYRGEDVLSMVGHWQIRVLLNAADRNKHETTFDVYVSV